MGSGLRLSSTTLQSRLVLSLTLTLILSTLHSRLVLCLSLTLILSTLQSRLVLCQLAFRRRLALRPS